jgi:hypothetical protein
MRTRYILVSNHPFCQGHDAPTLKALSPDHPNYAEGVCWDEAKALLIEDVQLYADYWRTRLELALAIEPSDVQGAE